MTIRLAAALAVAVLLGGCDFIQPNDPDDIPAPPERSAAVGQPPPLQILRAIDHTPQPRQKPDSHEEMLTKLERARRAAGGESADAPPTEDPHRAAWERELLARRRDLNPARNAGPVAMALLVGKQLAADDPAPTAMNNLLRWMSGSYEAALAWQQVTLDDSLSDWLNAPILCIVDRGPMHLTAPQRDQLLGYVQRGGVLLAVSDNREFANAIHTLSGQLWPTLKFSPAGPNHPILNNNVRIAPRETVQVLENGVRTLVVLVTEDISSDWAARDASRHRDAFQLPANLWQYVTDDGHASSVPPPGRPWADVGTVAPVGKRVVVGRLAWGKDTAQWAPELFAWVRMRNRLMADHGVQPVIGAVDFNQPVKPAAVPVVHLTGVGRLTLTERQLANLSAYVAAGGLLLVDAAGGDAAFADSSREVLAAAFDLKPGKLPFEKAFADESGHVGYRNMNRLPRSSRPLDCLVHETPGGPGVILLPYDLTAAMAALRHATIGGLSPESAEAFIAALLRWKLGIAGG